MSGCKTIAIVLVLAAGVHLGEASALAGDMRMTGAVYRDGNTDEAMTDLLIAELSAQEHVQVLSRRELKLVLGERALAIAVGDSDRQGRMGRLLGVDAFAWVHLSADSAVLEVVEAATGRGLWATGEKLDANAPQGAIAALARQAVAAARRLPAGIDPNTPTLAMAEPVPAGEGAAQGPAALGALGALEGDLETKGVQMLHRQFLKDLVLERWMADKGFTESQRKDLPMLGARFILASRVDGSPFQLTLALLETATGRRIGSRSVALADANTPQAREETVQWVLRRVEPRRAAAAVATKPAGADLPIQPEALAPFYQGVLLHNQGAYLDAAAMFEAANARDQRLLEPLCWMTSCFRGAGFDEVAQEYGAAVDKLRTNRWSCLRNPRLLNAGKGAALVGLTAGTESPSLQLAVLMRLIDALHDATTEPVFVTADMAQLRDEYDALVGLENTAGTTWRQAPPLLFADTLTAHLETGERGLRLRLCATHMLDPNQIAGASVDLDDDQAAWTRQIAEACRQVLASDPARRPAWRPPAAILLGEAKAMDGTHGFDLLDYLKTLTRNGKMSEYLEPPQSNDSLKNAVWTGLHRWFIRTLGDDPAKPGLEFTYDTVYLHGPERLAALDRLVREHPGSGMALAARLYVLMARFEEEDLAQTQGDLEDLLTHLKAHVPEVLSPHDFGQYEDLNRLMLRALGRSGGGEGELHPAGQLWARFMRGQGVRLQAGYGFQPTLKYPGTCDPQRQALVELAVERRLWRGEYSIPAKLVKDIFTRYADHPDVLAYFSVTYAQMLFGPRQESTPQAVGILMDVYPLHARAVLEVLAADPLPFNWQQVGILVGVNAPIMVAGKASPAYQKARGEIRQAVLDALDAGKFGNIRPVEISFLLSSVSYSGDPDMVPYLQGLANRCLPGDPLTDGRWRVYGAWDPWPTPAHKAEIYLPFYRRVRELHPDSNLNDSTVWQYLDFGLVFFRGGRLDLAEEALWPVTSCGNGYFAQYYKPNAYYLLALIRQKQGNIPEAMRLAQKAAETAGPGVGLTSRIDFEGTVGVGGPGRTTNLKSLANDLIAAMRQDPNAPPPDPFGDAGPPKRAWRP